MRVDEEVKIKSFNSTVPESMNKNSQVAIVTPTTSRVFYLFTGNLSHCRKLIWFKEKHTNFCSKPGFSLTIERGNSFPFFHVFRQVGISA